MPCSRRSPRDTLREGNARAPQLDRLSDIAAGSVPFAGPIPASYSIASAFRHAGCNLQDSATGVLVVYGLGVKRR